MDKNKIKAFAIWARRKLISAVSERANRIGITENNVEKAVAVQGGFKLEGRDEIFKLSKEHREKLVKEVNEKGFGEVMEEVAYTWFNRFMGLRYMEINEYLPSGIRVLSSEVEGKTEPDVLTRVSEIIDELNLNSEYIYELLDSGKTEDREEAYKHILVRQCNELGKIIPQMFEKISDYTELLLPDNLLEEGSVIRKMVEDIEERDFQEEVEIIGWMYQYYISEKKDEVFAALKKNVKITKENIPAATQLFTPKWIVKYMVENSLGRLWMEKLEVDSGQWKVVSDELKSKWKYYLEEAQQEPEVEEELKKIREEHSKLTPEDIKVLDPCMGSGHILVYAFDVLYEIYKTAGYSEREIPRMILQNNLYGLDIDDRAAQLASFALIMKARHYNRRLFREIEREGLELNLCSIQESNEISGSWKVDIGKLEEITNYFCNRNIMISGQYEEVAMDTVVESRKLVDGGQCIVDREKLREDFEYLVNVFVDAKEYGSILEVEKVDFEALKQRLREIEQEENFMFGDYRKMLLDKLPIMIKQAEIMSSKYDVCVTNPPYMSKRSMNNKLTKFVNSYYKESSLDMFLILIDKCIKFSKQYKYTALITQHSWMFLSRSEDFRKNMLDKININSLIHLGARAFEEIGGEVVQTASFVIQKNNNKDYLGNYINLKQINNHVEKEKEYFNHKNYYKASSKGFKKISGSPIAYWISEFIRDIYMNSNKLESYAITRAGMITGNNELFTRMWFEVASAKIGFNYKDRDNAKISFKKWFPYNKGGEYRKWYGNNDYVVNWENDGFYMRNLKDRKGNTPAHAFNLEYIFKKNITWTSVSANRFSARFSNNGYLFDAGGSCAFIEDKYNKFLLAFLCSKLAYEFLKIQNPTMNFQKGNISDLPLKLEETNSINNLIESLTEKCIKTCKKDWDSFETSWDFKIHPFLLVNSGECVVDGREGVDSGQWILDRNKEQKNTNHYKYISDVFDAWKLFTDKQFEQLKANEEELNRIFIDIYGLQDELTPEVEDKDITIRKADRERDIKSFISYAVGCMLGRYSIDAEGLIYAGGSVNSGKCIVEDNEKSTTHYTLTTNNYKKLTSFEEILSKIVNEVKKNESAELSRVDSVAEGNGFSGECIQFDKEISKGRDLCTYKSDTQSCSFDTFKYSRRTITQVDSRVSKFLVNCTRFKSGSGDANTDCPAFKLCESRRCGEDIEANTRNCENDICTKEQPKITTHYSLSTINHKFHCPLSTIHYLPDPDNVLPITEDEYFEDDIVSRFIEFVRIVYSEETLEENLDFIADSIGRKSQETARQAIRRYFIKDFYKDHLKVYQKRPIYWMFESGKNDGFKALVYMHRYNEQTVARVRTDYLHTLQRKYEAEIERQQLIVDSEEYTAKDRTAAKKKIDRIAKQIEECREYDQVVAHLANEKISIDLDDGVKVNYAKFQGIKVINSKGKEVKMNLLAKI